MTALTIWRAQRVRRWHTNHELSHTSDFIDGHSARVAKLILQLCNNAYVSRALLIAALIHDDGEHAVGDIAQPAKVALRQLEPAAWARIEATEEDALAETWGDVVAEAHPLDPTEARWLKFADRLDAFIWAANHGARMDRGGWPEDAEWLTQEALDLECLGQFYGILDDLGIPAPVHVLRPDPSPIWWGSEATGSDAPPDAIGSPPDGLGDVSATHAAKSAEGHSAARFWRGQDGGVE